MGIVEQLLYEATTTEKTGRDRDDGCAVFTLVEAGTRIVAVQRLVAGKHDFLVVGSERWPNVECVHALEIDPRSGSVGCVVKTAAQRYAIVDGKAGRSQDAIEDQRFANGFAYAAFDKKNGPDSKRFAYAIGTNSGIVWIVDDVTGPPFPGDGRFLHAFAPDGRFADVMQKKPQGKAVVMIDHVEIGKPYDAIHCLQWLPHANCFGAIAVRGKERVLLRVT